jgi:hypothetical protein
MVIMIRKKTGLIGEEAKYKSLAAKAIVREK